ncbi:MAG: DinB family protein [Bacteroidetes bacterium]|nr:DinB family protein [Bacteroidota bacterium]
MVYPKSFRHGPVGALMDEYERAAADLLQVIMPLKQADYEAIVDTETQDPDCRSILTIMNHVVMSGYGYANSIRKNFGAKEILRKDDCDVGTPQAACAELTQMLAYTVDTVSDHWGMTEAEAVKPVAKFSSGQVFDFEQLMEHAIVHVLRHRRQIELFLIKRAS